ncbi:MAG: tyrosine-type recombinase/integrase [Planctomycetaceae bacterium]|nr:tyrosine-type recombinase/integrase [Planctomycetaceae bacterium]
MKRKLTDRFLDSIKAPEVGRASYSDALRNGLQLRVGPSKRSWMYEKRVRGGPKRKHSLGTWPAMSLADARALALEIQAEAERGIDRVANAEAARLAAERDCAAQKTVADALERYEQLKLSTLRTGQERARELRKALSGYLDRHISDLSRAVLQDAIDAKAEAGRLVYANRIRAYLRAFTKWAYGRDYIAEDVGQRLDAATTEAPRDRVLSLEEVRAIYQATFELGPMWGPMFRLLIVTGQRRSEIAKLKWPSVDLDGCRMVLAGSETKNGKPHITHLSSAAHAELAELARQGRDRDLVFTTTGTTAVSGISKAKRRLDSILGDAVAHWRLHDLRRAMATYLAGAGIAEGVVDRIQNHSASGSAPSAVARVYQQADLLPQRAAALDKWADMVTRKNAEVLKLVATE